MAGQPRATIFRSFDEENQAEYRRRAKMTPKERYDEFTVLQERAWGKDWASQPMVKIATWEDVDW